MDLRHGWQLRQQTIDSGRTFKAYVYSSHERSNIRRISAQLGLLNEVEEFAASDAHVDLFQVFRDQLLTGNPIGLKKTAPLSSFSWEQDEVGGDLSMVKHDEAVRGSEDAIDWTLKYNRNDVEATQALRVWLDEHADNFHSIEDVRGLCVQQ